MARVDVSVIAGDTFDRGFRVSGMNGPKDLTLPGTLIHANILDSTGSRVVRALEMVPRDLAAGSFVVHLDGDVTRTMRGKYIWQVKFEDTSRVVTLASGYFTVKVID